MPIRYSNGGDNSQQEQRSATHELIFIQLFTRCLLRTNSMSDSVLSAGDFFKKVIQVVLILWGLLYFSRW